MLLLFFKRLMLWLAELLSLLFAVVVGETKCGVAAGVGVMLVLWWRWREVVVPVWWLALDAALRWGLETGALSAEASDVFHSAVACSVQHFARDSSLVAPAFFHFGFGFLWRRGRGTDLFDVTNALCHQISIVFKGEVFSIVEGAHVISHVGVEVVDGDLEILLRGRPG